MKYRVFFKKAHGKTGDPTFGPYDYQCCLAQEPWPELVDVPTGMCKSDLRNGYMRASVIHKEHPIDWNKTTWESSWREQLRQAQRLTVRRRLEALGLLAELSERLQDMRYKTGKASGKNRRLDTDE